MRTPDPPEGAAKLGSRGRTEDTKDSTYVAAFKVVPTESGNLQGSPELRLRAPLKAALRAFGMRCVNLVGGQGGTRR